ncbi:MAG: stalk domain-containing protein [Bacillota bacterium]
MRRRWITGALAIALALSAGAGAGAWAATSVRQQIEVEYRQIQIKVDGEAVTVDAEPFLYLEKGRVFIPARPLAEALGARVEWEDQTSTVQVYTKRHVISRVEGERRVWSMPGAGFEVRAPLGWLRQEGDGSALLHLALPDPNGLNGLVGITRLPEETAPLATQFDQVIEGMRFVYTDLKLTEQSDAGGRITARGTAMLAGRPVGLSFRMIESQGGNWLLFGLYPEASRSTLEPAIDGIFSSFVQR